MQIAIPIDANNQMWWTIGLGIMVEVPVRYTPAARKNIAKPMARGIIHDPNMRDNGIIMSKSSRGDRISAPISINIAPNVSLIICYLMLL